MKRTILALSLAAGGAALTASAADFIPSGTTIGVRTMQQIRGNQADGQVFPGSIANDVADQNGNVIVPRGSNAELIVRRTGNNEIVVDLDSVTVGGHRYSVAATEDSRRGRAGLGGNKRTGEFVGGGAVLGTLLGAIAGGGKGAAIGALAGGGAGAGTQVLTRGGSLNIPSETVLNFQLTQQLVIRDQDTGFDRDGRHYHRGYGNPYDRPDNRNYDPR